MGWILLWMVCAEFCARRHNIKNRQPVSTLNALNTDAMTPLRRQPRMPPYRDTFAPATPPPCHERDTMVTWLDSYNFVKHINMC